MSLAAQPVNAGELFPVNWVLTETVQTVVRVSPLGVCLLQMVRIPPSDTRDEDNRDESVTDFVYLAINDVLQAMINLPVEDILHRNLRFLTHNTNVSALIGRLAQAVHTGQPGQCVETYQLDGAIRTYHQLYVKSGDGVLMLIQDVTYNPLLNQELDANDRLIRAIEHRVAVDQVRTLLLDFISGQTA